MSHTCHAAGCPREVEPKLLMCLRHWRMVPRHLQREVYAAVKAVEAAEFGGRLL